MSDLDLTPMLDDPNVGAALKADLAVAQGAVVDGFNASAGLAALKTSIAAQGAASTTAAASTSLLTKVVVGAVVVGGAAVAWVASRPPPEPEPVKAPVAIVQPPAIDELADEVAPKVEAPVPEEEAEEVELVVDDDAQPEPVKPRKPKVKAEPAPKESLEERLMREATMVADARRALASDPARALALAKSAAKDFPKGQLVEEREALRIRALSKLGRSDEARRRAERYLQKHPRGPHADAVRRSVGIQ